MVRAKYNVPAFVDISLLTVAPHMHLVATSTKTYAITPAGDTINIINVPKWDFHWQGFYPFPKPLKIPGGSVIHCETEYDNTVNNPDNPHNPPQDVDGGEATDDEMLLVYFSYMFYQPGDENIVLGDTVDAPLVTVGLPPTPSLPRHEVSVRCYPNPATGGEVSLMYFLPANTRATHLTVSDVIGKVLTTLSITDLQPGYHSLPLPTEGYPAGAYFVSLHTDKGVQTEKLLVK